MIFVIFQILRETFTLSYYFFASFVSQEGSDSFILTFLLGICLSASSEILLVFVCLFCLFCCFTSQVNSYGHCGTVSSPNNTFSWAGLSKRLTSNSCTYFRL